MERYTSKQLGETMKLNKINDGISIIIITYNRKLELEKTLYLLSDLKCDYPWEVIIIDQNSDDGTTELFKDKNKSVKYVRLSDNKGVAGGRNIGVKYAQYEYMIFIDDDANFVKRDALNTIYHLMKTQDSYDLFAFKITNLEGDLYNWPYSKKRLASVNKTFEAKFFIGCGHAIKKSTFKEIGGYSDILFFWGEETELILKVLSSGKKLVYYDGSIEILHRVKGNGRNSDSGRFFYQVRNRLFIVRNLFPRITVLFFEGYYRLGYYVKAKRNGWESEYKKGIESSALMRTQFLNRLHLSHLIKYFWIR